MMEELVYENWGKIAHVREPYECQVKEALGIIGRYLYHHPFKTIVVGEDSHDGFNRIVNIAIADKELANRLINKDNSWRLSEKKTNNKTKMLVLFTGRSD